MQRLSWIFALGASLALFSVVDADASLYLDIDSESLSQQVSSGQTISGTFDITAPGSDCILFVCDAGGFDPASEQAYWAEVVFTFYDGQGDISYTIELGDSQTLSDPADVAALGYYVQLGTLNAEALGDLNADGQLTWSVTNEGDSSSTTDWTCWFRLCTAPTGFVLKSAELVAATGGGTVPEPSAAALFAAGALAVGHSIRRRPRSA